MDEDEYVRTRPFRKLYQTEGVLAVVWKTPDEPINGFMDASRRPVCIPLGECLFRIYDEAKRESTLMEGLVDEPVVPLLGGKPLNYQSSEYRACVIGNEHVTLLVLVYKGHTTLTKSLQRMVRSALKTVGANRG